MTHIEARPKYGVLRMTIVMDVVSALASLSAAYLAYRHAINWGRLWESIDIYAPARESVDNYVLPVRRVIQYYGIQVGLLLAAWALFPIGHWGLLAVPGSVYGFRAGVRTERLTLFVLVLSDWMKRGESFNRAWDIAETTIRSSSGRLRVAGYRRRPDALVEYVAARAHRFWAASIRSEWEEVRPG